MYYSAFKLQYSNKTSPTFKINLPFPLSRIKTYTIEKEKKNKSARPCFDHLGHKWH
uniref:Uncharacterized protein n=1 Tax=Rhizophora mucronata TaxID=61149 RepID=A0A2P2KBN1_RHIMU